MTSIISRKESTAVKGFLTLLILLFHNILLCTDRVSGDYLPIRRYVYLFHVTSFFILPLLYGYVPPFENQKWKNLWWDIRSGFVRCWIPYTCFFVCFFVFGVFSHKTFVPSLVFYAYFEGTQSPLAWILGVHFLWFLPSMFALLIMKSAWCNFNIYVKWCMLILALFVFVQDAFNPFEKLDLWDTVPFSLVQGIMYFGIAILTRFIIEKSTQNTSLTFSIFTTFLLTILFIYNEHLPESSQSTNLSILRWLMPIAIFPLIYKCRKLLEKLNVFLLLGKYSLYIYLTHIIIYNIVNPFMLQFFDKSYCLGLVTFIITTFISIACSYFIDHSLWIKKIVFPKLNKCQP